MLCCLLIAGTPTEIYLAQQQREAIEKNYQYVKDRTLSVDDVILFYVRHSTNYIPGYWSNDVIKQLLVQTAFKNHVHPAPQWLR